ncbi:MAG: T9SS type A sorting domain-containing protein [Flavobacteriales bacterium]
MLAPFLLLLPLALVSQVKEVPLRYNPVQAFRHAQHQEVTTEDNRGGSLTIPFFDDFSHYSLPPINNPAEWQMWSDDMAYVNCTFPVSPLTIGVATLDGLQANGQPYEWDEPEEVRGCDTLTSLPITLLGYTPEDTLYLLFHYQNGGWGNTTEVYDTLYLDFYTPVNSGNWINVWKIPGGGSNSEFQQVFIPVIDDIYLMDGFKMRFRNLGRPGGSVDHWHLDYLLLADQIDPDDFEFNEVGFQYCNNTLLDFGYASMPWTHYLSNPQSFMDDDITLRQRNLGNTENITSIVTIHNEETLLFTSGEDNNTNNNAFQELNRPISLEGFEYPDTGAEFEEEFQVCGTFAQTDAHLQNDTMCFEQFFGNYYAYDDGSAESGWGMNAAGARAALRFDCEIPDTLLGVMMHWIPFVYDHSEESFLMRVYDVNGNIPGTELNPEDFQFYSPQYGYDGYNPFYYYELNTPIALDGPFFIGWIQQDAEEVYIGNDKNTNMNPTQLYYKLSAFTDWTLNSITGSIMLRPVFKNGNEEWAGVDELVETLFQVYPNPATEALTISMKADFEMYSTEIYDLTGRLLHQSNFLNAGQVDVSIVDLPDGIYMISVKNSLTESSSVVRFIKGQ